ncbi:hypothetical protein [Paenibacillus popilliae]|uniref:DoxX family protein n=1 Tax=Paenibacillus popilliae TaxID=78057 RepID=A0ABY3AL13_PAEPP|nr:hypothetical protein [Paenibacillus sp. SDF0028]TQR43289.1 hypothetical protein C7Y44_19120 [Paenibacillus sp. SDF0028]
MNVGIQPGSGLYLHVKWFAADHEWTPQAMSKVLTPTFLFWFSFTIVVLLLVSRYNAALERIPIVVKVHSFLNKLKRFHLLIMRVGVGIALLMQISTGSYLAPTLRIETWWVYALLIISLLGLLHRKTLFISGIALGVLYVKALANYGMFHMLDYMFYLGIIYYLLVANTRWSRSGIPVLYVWTGLSLAWLAMEKLTLAKLACSLMHEYGIPSLGFTVEDFVLISAFIELGLAWAFIVGIMNRFTALLLTGLFLVTTTVFGFTEIIGHMIMHTILLIFLIVGRDGYTTFLLSRRAPKLRSFFVVLHFTIMIFSMMTVYIWMGQPSSGFTVPDPATQAAQASKIPAFCPIK